MEEKDKAKDTPAATTPAPSDPAPIETTPAANQPLPQPELDEKVKAAREVNEAYKRENDRREALIMEERRLRVADELGGKTEVTKEETEKEKAKKGSQALVPDGVYCPGVTAEK